MKSSYKIHTSTGGTYYETKDLSLLNEEGYEESQESITTSYARCEYKEILLDSVAIIIRDDIIDAPLSIDLKYNYPYIKIHFELGEESVYTPNTSDGIKIAIGKNQFNFFYLPVVDGTLSFINQHKKSLEIVISEQYIRNIFKSGFEQISGRFGNALGNRKPYKLFEHSANIPSSLLIIINEIVNCSFQQEIKMIYLESKVKEVFSYIFSIINADMLNKRTVIMSSEERKQVFQIERFLEAKMDESYTIKKLSLLFGINETKLKRNFKQMTGKPIFSYLTDLRMEKAKSLLINNRLNVSEVAYVVGYKNPQHFTAAFKRKFNCVPSDFKKRFFDGL